MWTCTLLLEGTLGWFDDALEVPIVIVDRCFIDYPLLPNYYPTFQRNSINVPYYLSRIPSTQEGIARSQPQINRFRRSGTPWVPSRRSSCLRKLDVRNLSTSPTVPYLGREKLETILAMLQARSTGPQVTRTGNVLDRFLQSAPDPAAQVSF